MKQRQKKSDTESSNLFASVFVGQITRYIDVWPNESRNSDIVRIHTFKFSVVLMKHTNKVVDNNDEANE